MERGGEREKVREGEREGGGEMDVEKGYKTTFLWITNLYIFQGEWNLFLIEVIITQQNLICQEITEH